MNSYSQNGEDLIIFQYLPLPHLITLLEIGANNGVTYSNSRKLIEQGAKAVLVEPSENVFPELGSLYKDNENVYLVKAAIGIKDDEAKFYDSGVEKIHGGAKSLLATMSQPDKNKWNKVVDYKETTVRMITFDTLLKESPYKTFDFISIDAEGYDLQILEQIDLTKTGTKVICIEHNGIKEARKRIVEICSWYSLEKVLVDNQENLVLAK